MARTGGFGKPPAPDGKRPGGRAGRPAQVPSGTRQISRA